MPSRRLVKDPERYKTVLCATWVQSGECPYGRKCQFAHGKEELRSRTAPPLSSTMPRQHPQAQPPSMGGMRPPHAPMPLWPSASHPQQQMSLPPLPAGPMPGQSMHLERGLLVNPSMGAAAPMPPEYTAALAQIAAGAATLSAATRQHAAVAQQLQQQQQHLQQQQQQQQQHHHHHHLQQQQLMAPSLSGPLDCPPALLLPAAEAAAPSATPPLPSALLPGALPMAAPPTSLHAHASLLSPLGAALPQAMAPSTAPPLAAAPAPLPPAMPPALPPAALQPIMPPAAEPPLASAPDAAPFGSGSVGGGGGGGGGGGRSMPARPASSAPAASAPAPLDVSDELANLMMECAVAQEESPFSNPSKLFDPSELWSPLRFHERTGKLEPRTIAWGVAGASPETATPLAQTGLLSDENGKLDSPIEPGLPKLERSFSPTKMMRRAVSFIFNQIDDPESPMRGEARGRVQSPHTAIAA